MAGAWARHPQPRIPAPDCSLSMLQVGSYLGQSGQEAAICIVLTICTAPARLGAVVLTSAWLEDGPHGARDHSVWQWLSLRWRRHCSERSSSMEVIERPSAQDPAESGHECHNRGTATMSRSRALTHTRRWNPLRGWR